MLILLGHVTHAGDRAALLCLRREHDVVTLLPALDDESFAGENMRGEAGVDLLHALWVLRQILLLDGTGAEAVRAETMENGCLEAALSGHLRVDVKWVPVVAQTVKEGLVLLSLLLHDTVGGALRDRQELLLDGAFVAEATGATNKQAGSDRAMKLASLGGDDGAVKD